MGSVERIPFRRAFVDPLSDFAILYGTLTNIPTRGAARWWFYVMPHPSARLQSEGNGWLMRTLGISLTLGSFIVPSISDWVRHKPVMIIVFPMYMGTIPSETVNPRHVVRRAALARSAA